MCTLQKERGTRGVPTDAGAADLSRLILAGVSCCRQHETLPSSSRGLVPFLYSKSNLWTAEWKYVCEDSKNTQRFEVRNSAIFFLLFKAQVLHTGYRGSGPRGT